AQVGLAEQLGEERAVEREGLRPALGERRVALVHERAHVPQQQRRGERGGLGGLHLDDPHPPGRHVPQQRHQAGHVEHVLEALARRGPPRGGGPPRQRPATGRRGWAAPRGGPGGRRRRGGGRGGRGGGGGGGAGGAAAGRGGGLGGPGGWPPPVGAARVTEFQ